MKRAMSEGADEGRSVGFLINALECRGVTTFWVSLGVMRVPPAPAVALEQLAAGRRVLPTPDGLPSMAYLEPATPPPRA